MVWLVLVAGCASETQAQRETGLTPLEERGWQVFERERCLSSCHLYGILFPAETRAPGTIPDLRKTPHRTRDWYLAYLIYPQAILPRSPMPPFTHLSGEDFEALVAFLQRINRDVVVPAPEPVSLETIPRTARDLAAYRGGREIYRFHCVGCHGNLGNGAGPVGHLLTPEPRDFTDVVWMSKQTDEYLFSVITNGKTDTAMTAFKDLLNAEERAQVLGYVRHFADPVSKERMEQGFVPPERPREASREPGRSWIR